MPHKMHNQLFAGMWRTSICRGSNSSRESIRVPCHLSVCPSVCCRMSGGAASPVNLTRHNGRAHWGRYCHISRSEAEQLVHGSSNKEQPGPGVRQTAVAIAAGQLPLCTCRARQTARWMSCQIQVNSRGDRDGAATDSARRTSVAFAAGRKQNAAQRSDRQTFTR